MVCCVGHQTFGGVPGAQGGLRIAGLHVEGLLVSSGHLGRFFHWAEWAETPKWYILGVSFLLDGLLITKFIIWREFLSPGLWASFWIARYVSSRKGWNVPKMLVLVVFPGAVFWIMWCNGREAFRKSTKYDFKFMNDQVVARWTHTLSQRKTHTRTHTQIALREMSTAVRGLKFLSLKAGQKEWWKNSRHRKALYTWLSSMSK